MPANDRCMRLVPLWRSVEVERRGRTKETIPVSHPDAPESISTSGTKTQWSRLVQYLRPRGIQGAENNARLMGFDVDDRSFFQLGQAQLCQVYTPRIFTKSNVYWLLACASLKPKELLSLKIRVHAGEQFPSGSWARLNGLLEAPLLSLAFWAASYFLTWLAATLFQMAKIAVSRIWRLNFDDLIPF